MGTFCPRAGLQAAFLDTLCDAVQFELRKYRNASCLYEVCEFVDALHNFRRHRRFEGAVSHEHNNVVNIFRVKAEEVAYCSDMHFVLLEGVLKSQPKLIIHLRPSGMVRVTEYPTRHVFGLNDEYSVRRDDQMIDLRGRVADW